jgi:hypothetical protein
MTQTVPQQNTFPPRRISSIFIPQWRRPSSVSQPFEGDYYSLGSHVDTPKTLQTLPEQPLSRRASTAFGLHALAINCSSCTDRSCDSCRRKQIGPSYLSPRPGIFSLNYAPSPCCYPTLQAAAELDDVEEDDELPENFIPIDELHQSSVRKVSKWLETVEPLSPHDYECLNLSPTTTCAQQMDENHGRSHGGGGMQHQEHMQNARHGGVEA